MKEIRHLNLGEVELRNEEMESDKLMVSGYAARFNSITELYDGLQEQIATGAFSSSIGGDIRALWDHDTRLVLGRTKNNTLKLSEDSIGLRFDLEINDTTFGKDTYKLIKRGDISGVSFGFRVKDEEWKRLDKDTVLRTIKDVELFEISPVTFPAYRDTEVYARSIQEVIKRCPIEFKNDWHELQKRKINLLLQD
jgi:HK97 family phage prohead protease